ncbi:hypothetical protein BOX15_Mlig019497g1 [Macrostomum lignano]|uniref:Uncharacterized protein n=1 Tax=Macrostomum lignano TaxID=282301 RepID=A0A267DXD9_9PLAT|nr:hypothetical protein BOX15_Mlig019497g2 [Macrostomum lignano]PAA86079.1 hypothetical protein BOX15_Mlig019497g1 [Macrostomum lignano]
MASEVTISLIVVGLLVTMLLVSIAVVLAYYWKQSRRMTQPKRDSRPPGYRTTVNSDKLKKYAAAKVRGVDEMKEPVNWSNRYTARSSSSGRKSTQINNLQPQIQTRCRSLSPPIATIQESYGRRRQLST